MKMGSGKDFIHDFGFRQTKIGKMYKEEELKKKLKVQTSKFDHRMQVARA